MSHGGEVPSKFDLSKLRLVACAGEPLNRVIDLDQYDNVQEGLILVFRLHADGLGVIDGGRGRHGHARQRELAGADGAAGPAPHDGRWEDWARIAIGGLAALR